MRREHRLAEQDRKVTDFTFHFQITSNGGRQACSVKVQAPNVHDATAFFRQNWLMIELMARDGLANRSQGNTIKLAVELMRESLWVRRAGMQSRQPMSEREYAPTLHHFRYEPSSRRRVHAR